MFTAELPAGAAGVIFSAGQNGPQTVDITDFFHTGYYPDGTTDASGHYNVVGWSD